MSDDAAPAPAPAKAPAKPKTPKKKSSKPKVPAAHPKYNEMVKQAVSALKERGGSSRQAILKYIIKNFKVGNEKTANTHLKLALRAGVKNGSLKQSKGSGASGSFKLGTVEKKPKKAAKAKKPKSDKPKTAKKPAAKKAKKPAAKKAKSPKKAAKPKKTAKPKKATKPKSPKKASKPKAKKAAKPKAKKAAAKKWELCEYVS